MFNSLTVLLLVTEKKLLSVFFNKLLLCLVIIDNVYLSITILDVWIISTERLYENYALFYSLFFIVYPTRSIIMCCTIYMTAILSFERYSAIATPLRHRTQSTEEVTWLRVLKFVGPMVLICTLFNIPKLFEYSVETIEAKDTINKSPSRSSVVLAKEYHNTHNITTNLILSHMRRNKLYVLLYINFANIPITGVVPLLAILYLNFHVYKGLNKFIRRRAALRSMRRASTAPITRLCPEGRNNGPASHRSQSLILFAIVLLFIVCHALRILLNAEDFIYHENIIEEMGKGCKYGTRYWALLVVPISEILLRFNSSLTFFIYCAFNRSFRNAICRNISKMLNKCSSIHSNEDSVENNYELQALRTTRTQTTERTT